jgi:uncharacterized membrane protein YidH (DUF202 family)
MAATKVQGKSFTLFLVGLTAAAAGIAYLSSTGGKVVLLIGAVVVAASFWKFLQIKPEEGKVALRSQPAVQKLVGVALTLLGWLVVLAGLFVTSSISGRLFTSIVGLAISLVGVLYILPSATSKNAIWKP